MRKICNKLILQCNNYDDITKTQVPEKLYDTQRKNLCFTHFHTKIY